MRITTTGLAYALLACTIFLFSPLPRAAAAETNGGSDEGWTKFVEDVALKHPAGEGKFRLRSREGHFNEFRLKVEGASVILQEVKVLYDDGTQEDFTMKRFVRTGKNSPVLRLSNGERVVKRVLFSYEIKSNEDGAPRAAVSLWTR